MEAPKAPARPRTKKVKPAVEAVAAIEVVPAKAAPKVAKSRTAVPPAAAAPAPAKARKPKTAPVKAADQTKAEAAPAPVQEAPAPEALAPAPVAAAVDPSSLVTLQAQAVLAAIQEGRAVELIFADAENNPPRTFEPRQLIFDTFAKGWYVWGWDRRYNAERHHLLALIAQVNPVDGMGRAAQGPYKEGTPANLIGGWLGGEAIHVKAVLLKQWIFAVRQAPAPFPEFRIEDLEEGKAQVSFTATDLRAITRWVMQFGDGIQILEPQRLLDRVKQVGLAWGGKAVAAAPAVPAPKPAQPRQEHRSERKPEHRSERAEHRFEAKPDQPSERKAPEQPRHSREPRENYESPKPSKAGKIEIRIDRL
jgi:predicted DNA-binding transcriptional regulator YafY